MSLFERFYKKKGDRDEDAVYDDGVTHYLILKVRRNGAMSVEGHIEDEIFALAMLENAKDAVKAHNARKIRNIKEELITPFNDTPLAGKNVPITK